MALRPDDGTPPGPRYGQACISDLLPSLLHGLGVDDEPDVLGLADEVDRAVVVLVVDGLGLRQLQDHADAAPFLSEHVRRELDAVVPATTAAGLSSLCVGAPPGRHGLVGYTVAIPERDEPFNLLTWRVGGEPAASLVDPTAYQPALTAFERARRAGVATNAFVRTEFVGSGLTRAIMRGAMLTAFDDAVPTVRAAIEAAAGDGPTLVYSYLRMLDRAGHDSGPGSPTWLDSLRFVDKLLEVQVTKRLPGDALLVVSADHGMVPAGSFLDLAENVELLDGVRVAAGDGRLRQLHTRPGAAEDVVDAWLVKAPDDLLVLTRDEAIDLGWFGPAVEDRVRPRIGDVLVVALGDRAVVHAHLDHRGGRMAGLHAALTRAEVEVPLILADGGAA